MQTSKVKKTLCAVAVSALCAFSLVACSQEDVTKQSSDPHDLSAGVAAEINGHKIGEAAINNQVAMLRSQNNLETDEAWAQWMVDNDQTPELVRSHYLDVFINQEVIYLGAEEHEVTADESIIDSQVSYMKAQFDNDEESWNKALEAQGITEEDYRNMVKFNILTQELIKVVAPETEPSEADMLEHGKLYAQMYNGAKKSSHILFSFEDEAVAQDVLQKIKSGALSFEDAVAQYSTDEGSKINQGNVGWDKMTSFVPEYTDALAGLNKGDVSDLVKSEFGYHIIKCTDVFTVDGELTSIDQLPAEFVDILKQQLKSYGVEMAFSEWMQTYRDGADVTINDIPADAVYNVDITGYEKSEPIAAPAPTPVPAPVEE